MTQTNASNAGSEPKPWHLPEYGKRPEIAVKPDQIIERQGRQFVLYAGLLHAAHEAGLREVRTTIVQCPSSLNEQTAIVHATVEFPWGSYSGIGDANPGNVGRMIAPHCIRMAETRAKARALRDALDVGFAAVEELGPDADDNGKRPAGAPPGTGDAAPRRVAQNPPAPRTQPTTPPMLSPGVGLPESLAKFERLKATATRLQESGKLALPDEMVVPFGEGASVGEVEARCGRLLNLINSAVQRPAPSS